MASIDPIREHARAYAREALRGGEPTRRPGEHLDEHMARYRSQKARHQFLVTAKEELDQQLNAHLDARHKDDEEGRRKCGQRPLHARAMTMVDDRLAAIDEQLDPLRARLN